MSKELQKYKKKKKGYTRIYISRVNEYTLWAFHEIKHKNNKGYRQIYEIYKYRSAPFLSVIKEDMDIAISIVLLEWK